MNQTEAVDLFDKMTKFRRLTEGTRSNYRSWVVRFLEHTNIPEVESLNPFHAVSLKAPALITAPGLFVFLNTPTSLKSSPSILSMPETFLSGLKKTRTALTQPSM